MIGVN